MTVEAEAVVWRERNSGAAHTLTHNLHQQQEPILRLRLLSTPKSTANFLGLHADFGCICCRGMQGRCQ